LSHHDVYLNVAGGLRITEPAADLAVAAALVSSFSGVALPTDHVYFGEISLSGAVRATGHMTTRLKEAQKLGFRGASIPSHGEVDAGGVRLALRRLSHVKDLAESIGACQ
jgi:DNA repair protein RadA/Sms